MIKQSIAQTFKSFFLNCYKLLAIFTTERTHGVLDLLVSLVQRLNHAPTRIHELFNTYKGLIPA